MEGFEQYAEEMHQARIAKITEDLDAANIQADVLAEAYSDAVRQMSRAQLVKISFDDSLEGHDTFFSPGDKNSIVKWVEQLAGIGR